MSNPLDYLTDCIARDEEADYSDRPERTLAASEPRKLLLSVPRPSVRMRGAIIEGPLDLSWCGSGQAPLPALCFTQCCFLGPSDEASLDLTEACVGALSLLCSRLTHLRAPGMHVRGAVNLSGLGPVDGVQGGPLCWCKLSRSVIGGHVLADGVQLQAPKPPADDGFQFSDILDWDWGLNLCASRIGGSVLLRGGAGYRFPSVRGGILIDAASIDGDVHLDAATIEGHPRKHAISLERARIAGSVTLAGRFGTPSVLRCYGAIWMMRSRIAGAFDLYGADLAAAAQGLAIYAVGATIGSRFTIGQQRVGNDDSGTVRLAGRTWLSDVHVEGNLEITNATVVPSGPVDDWFKHREPDGTVAVDLSGACIEGAISLDENHIEGNVDLRDARCASLQDSPSGYDGATSVLLDGFRYERVENTAWGAGIDARLEKWLPNDPELSPARRDYRPQPFIQLASVLAAHGDEAGAWEVLSKRAYFDGKQRWKLRPRSLGVHWIWYTAVLFYGWFFDFGLSPMRALGTLLLCIVVGAGLFGWMDSRNALVIAHTPVTSYVQEAGDTPKYLKSDGQVIGDISCGLTAGGAGVVDFAVTAGRLLVYAADVFVPLVDLREEGKCEVGRVEGASRQPANWEVATYQFLKALYATLGWIVTTLALLTFSGVLRNRLAHE